MVSASRRRKGNAADLKPGGGVLLLCILACVGAWSGVSLAQLDLSVFQKQGATEQQESKDRYECHRLAVQKTGFDPGVRPSDNYPPMRPAEKAELKAEGQVEWRKQQLEYLDVLKRCMKERGYTLTEH